MAAEQSPMRHLNRSQQGQSSQSSLSRRPSSLWHRESLPLSGGSLLSSQLSTELMDSQDLRDEVMALIHKSAINARQGIGESGGNGDEDIADATDAERPSKRRKTSPTQPGRGIRKIVDLYHDLTDLLSNAKKHSAILGLTEINPNSETIQQLDEIDFAGMTDEDIEEERKERKRCYTALILLNSLIPGFEQKAAENPIIYCAPLQTGANDARSDDTGRLKIVVAEWLNSSSLSTSTPRLSAKGKDERGINHDVTGHLLCPIDYNWDDPHVRAKLRNADPGYDFASSFFIRCLYKDNSGDPNFPSVGFLKGPFLTRAYRHIFTAPSSAYSEGSPEANSRRRDVATSLRLNGHVTPRSIAYTATQLIFSLNSARDWKQEHAGFNYRSFYNFIVDFFEDADNHTSTSAVNELLQWWNSEIFPVTARRQTRDARNIPRTAQRRLQASHAATQGHA